MSRSSADKPEFLGSIASFRGAAIVLIVAAHCFPLVGWQADSFPEKLLENLVKGGTALFVFISGFLFHHIFTRDFGYRRFLTKKLTVVLLPYLFLSTLPIFYYVFLRQGGPFAELIYSGRDGIWAQYVHPALMYLWTGRHLQAYWYIPFIMVVFALSPVFIGYLRLSLVARLLVLVGTLAIAMLVHRPVKNVSVLQSVVYFLPVYLLGMNVSASKERILARLAGKEWLLALGVLGFACAQVALYAKHSNFHKPALDWGGVDIVLPQKMIACVCFYVLFERLATRRLPLLDTLATSSFALYFLHPFIVLGLRNEAPHQWRFVSEVPPVLAWLAWVAIVIALAFGAATLIRWLTGRRSRQLIGW